MTVKTTTLAARGLALASGDNLRELFGALLGNIYDPETNPNGILNIGTAENACVQFH
jgi:hypothetical protein